MAEPAPLPMCPMAKTCRGMMKKPFSGIALIIPGIVFIALGVAIVIEPRVLVWVMAAVFIFLGIAMVIMASFIRGLGKQFRAAHQ